MVSGEGKLTSVETDYVRAILRAKLRLKIPGTLQLNPENGGPIVLVAILSRGDYFPSCHHRKIRKISRPFPV